MSAVVSLGPIVSAAAGEVASNVVPILETAGPLIALVVGLLALRRWFWGFE